MIHEDIKETKDDIWCIEKELRIAKRKLSALEALARKEKKKVKVLFELKPKSVKARLALAKKIVKAEGKHYFSDKLKGGGWKFKPYPWVAPALHKRIERLADSKKVLWTKKNEPMCSSAFYGNIRYYFGVSK